MSSDNIEGDMSKYELSIYDGNDYGNDDDDKKLNEAQITGQDSPSGIEFLKTLDDKGRYMFLSRMQSDCKYFLDGHEYNKFLWAGNVEDQIKYMKWLYNSFPKNKKPEWISMEEIEDYEKRMAGKGKEDHSRDEIDEQILDEGVGSRGMIKAIEKAFDDGRYGRYGKWECGLGGYDTGYQVSYEHIPFFEIKEDNTVKFLSNNLMKRKTGYTPQDIIDILSEIGDYTMTSESDDEELDESIDSDIEIGSVVALSDRYQNRCGDVIGFDGKMYQIDIDGDGSTYDVLPKDIIEVIQEPILDESVDNDKQVLIYGGSISFYAPKSLVMAFAHSGDNMEDAKALLPYVKDELSEYSDEQLKELLRDNGIEDADSKPREELELYTIWLCAWNFIDSDDPEDDNQLNESINTEIETGSTVLLKDGRKVEIIGRAYGSGGIQCGYKVFDEDTNTDGDPEEIMFDDIKRVIQEPINESDRLSELASKMVLREADESSVAKVKINSVKFEGKEGAQDDKNWVEGKTYSFEEFQKLVYEYDYAVWNQADRMGYDKLWYSADITIEYNGKQEHIGYDGR